MPHDEGLERKNGGGGARVESVGGLCVVWCDVTVWWQSLVGWVGKKLTCNVMTWSRLNVPSNERLVARCGAVLQGKSRWSSEG